MFDAGKTRMMSISNGMLTRSLDVAEKLHNAQLYRLMYHGHVKSGTQYSTPF